MMSQTEERGAGEEDVPDLDFFSYHNEHYCKYGEIFYCFQNITSFLFFILATVYDWAG